MNVFFVIKSYVLHLFRHRKMTVVEITGTQDCHDIQDKCLLNFWPRLYVYMILKLNWKTKFIVFNSVQQFSKQFIYFQNARCHCTSTQRKEWRQSLFHPGTHHAMLGQLSREVCFWWPNFWKFKDICYYNFVIMMVRMKCVKYNPVVPYRKQTKRWSEVKLTWDCEQKQWNSLDLDLGWPEHFSQDCSQVHWRTSQESIS